MSGVIQTLCKPVVAYLEITVGDSVRLFSNQEEDLTVSAKRAQAKRAQEKREGVISSFCKTLQNQRERTSPEVAEYYPRRQSVRSYYTSQFEGSARH